MFFVLCVSALCVVCKEYNIWVKETYEKNPRLNFHLPFYGAFHFDLDLDLDVDLDLDLDLDVDVHLDLDLDLGQKI